MSQASLSPVFNHIAEALRPAGYRRAGNTFYAERDEVLLLVQIQRSTTSSAGRTLITLNLGVYLKCLADRTGPTGRGASIPGCHWRERIGFLTPERRDRWWPVTDEASAGQVGHEFASILREAALPALESLASAAALRETWRSGRSPGLTDVQRQRYLEMLETCSAKDREDSTARGLGGRLT
jgi:hypothetical protein